VVVILKVRIESGKERSRACRVLLLREDSGFWFRRTMEKTVCLPKLRECYENIGSNGVRSADKSGCPPGWEMSRKGLVTKRPDLTMH